MQKKDSAISSPSTPKSSVSSQSNLVSTSSSNTPSPATPTQQQTVPLGSGYVATSAGSVGAPGSSGHKNSLKGTKLARRARSFKDDLFEKISLMRTPTNTLGRSHSPNSTRAKNNKPPPTAEEVARSSQSLDTHVKDISNALKHFRDVVLKKKLEVLPGNGTVILETIASMFAVIQSYTLNENSTVLLSATQQVYQSLGKLIKLCDEVMIGDEKGECASLTNDNVSEVVDLLEGAVKNLADLAQQKLKQREENAFKYVPHVGDVAGPASSNHLMRPPVEAVGQRTSLPDITLTPKERDILEKTNSNPIRTSHSTESILRDASPPPKPPLPNRVDNPPPLPPKRRSQKHSNQSLCRANDPSQNHNHNQNHHSNNISINSDLDCGSEFSLMNYGIDHLCVRSRSPDENSSQCSLDSALNHSREEEELKLLGLDSKLEENLLEDDVEKMFEFKAATEAETAAQVARSETTNDCDKHNVTVSNIANTTTITIATTTSTIASTTIRSSPTTSSNSSTSAFTSHGNDNSVSKLVTATTSLKSVSTVPESPLTAVLKSGGSETGSERPEMRKASSNRHSNESGFVSMKSFRTSTQSVSKRSSDYSFQSSTKSSNSEMAFSAIETSGNALTASSTTFSSAVEHHLSNTKVYSSTSTSTSSSAIGSCPGSGLQVNDDNCSISNTSSASPDHFEREKCVMSQIQSMSSLTKTNSLDISSSDDLVQCGGSVPPALPPKVARARDLRSSQLDNFDEMDNINSFSAHDLPELRQHNQQYEQQLEQQQQHLHHHQIYQWQSKHQSLIEPRRIGGLASSCNALGIDTGTDEPPPLPMKKKHILAYMEICSASTRSIEQHRHTMHSYNLNRNITHSQTMNIVPLTKEMSSPEHEIPPALPPKNYKRKPNAVAPPTIITTPPPSPKPTHQNIVDESESGSYASLRHGRMFPGTPASELMSTVCEEVTDLNDEEQASVQYSQNLLDEHKTNVIVHAIASEPTSHLDQPPDELPPTPMPISIPICTPDIVNEEDEGIDIVLEPHNYSNNNNNSIRKVREGHQVRIDVSIREPFQNYSTVNAFPKDKLPNMLEEIDIIPYLIFKKDHEDGPEVKGGYIDALIVHASRVQKISNNSFCEAFITTFRTFIQPIDVIEKLTHRYTVFFCQLNDQKQKAAKETFSLLVRVVNDLTSTDLTDQLHTLLTEFVFQLVCSGQLYQAKLLRNKFIEKVTLYKEQRMPTYHNNMYTTVINQPSLLDLKSVEIAEQMTLLDAELFQKIEIPEVLLFAKEQCEEKSPNLNKFTEHFNKMSYWARSKILMLPDAKEREKHVIKFIKIMKHLRKMNNYNSYLALLSALDSAPIRRLEWHKTITEGLKEYCTLIDSSSSFRVYRQALAETNPPCIPYIGLVLQDLTFVHVGNPDYLKENIINFSKRWQQYNIIVNMKRFNKCTYPYKRNERIINFFDNFEKFLGEEEMWQISESIKPRSKRPTHN